MIVESQRFKNTLDFSIWQKSKENLKYQVSWMTFTYKLPFLECRKNVTLLQIWLHSILFWMSVKNVSLLMLAKIQKTWKGLTSWNYWKCWTKLHHRHSWIFLEKSIFMALFNFTFLCFQRRNLNPRPSSTWNKLAATLPQVGRTSAGGR